MVIVIFVGIVYDIPIRGFMLVISTYVSVYIYIYVYYEQWNINEEHMQRNQERGSDGTEKVIRKGRNNDQNGRKENKNKPT